MTKHSQGPINIRNETVMPQFHYCLTLCVEVWPLQQGKKKKRYHVKEQMKQLFTKNKQAKILAYWILANRFQQLPVQNEIEKNTHL